jgi:hypothetical protein
MQGYAQELRGAPAPRDVLDNCCIRRRFAPRLTFGCVRDIGLRHRPMHQSPSSTWTPIASTLAQDPATSSFAPFYEGSAASLATSLLSRYFRQVDRLEDRQPFSLTFVWDSRCQPTKCNLIGNFTRSLADNERASIYVMSNLMLRIYGSRDYQDYLRSIKIHQNYQAMANTFRTIESDKSIIYLSLYAYYMTDRSFIHCDAIHA